MQEMALNNKKDKKLHKSKFNVTILLVTLFLIIYSAIVYLPYYWGFLTAFKDRIQLTIDKNDIFGFPSVWNWSNFSNVLNNFEYTFISYTESMTFTYLDMMWNSVTYTVVSVTVGTTSLYITAYVCAMFNYKWSGIMEGFNLFSMATPIFGSLPSSIKVFSALGLYENFFGIAVITKWTWTGVYFFVIEANVRSIPKAYVEAAQIDGAGNVAILLRVMFPLTINIYSVLYLLGLIGTWNSYSDIYVYLKSYPTAAFGLWHFDNNYSGKISGVQYKLAAGWIVALPVLFAFLIFNKQLMNGISMSEGVKE